jgi:hypothetical protein
MNDLLTTSIHSKAWQAEITRVFYTVVVAVTNTITTITTYSMQQVVELSNHNMGHHGNLNNNEDKYK